MTVVKHQFFVRLAKSEVVLARSICPVHCTGLPGPAAFRCNTQFWKTSLQCATRHSLLQYSLSHTRDSAAGLGQPLRMHRSRPLGSCCSSAFPSTDTAVEGGDPAEGTAGGRLEPTSGGDECCVRSRWVVPMACCSSVRFCCFLVSAPERAKSAVRSRAMRVGEFRMDGETVGESSGSPL